MASPLQFAKKLLFAMSDETFLSSLDSINFRTKHVEISHGYWLAIAKFVKNNYTLTDQPKYLTIVKSLFVERLTVVSATKIKKFFLGNIKRSFIDFKNLMYYIHHFLEHGNIVRKDLDKLRQTRYFEYKARQHYLWYISSLEENFYNQQDIQPSDFAVINRERLAVFPVADTQYHIEDYNNIQQMQQSEDINYVEPQVFSVDNNNLWPSNNVVDQIIDRINQRDIERITDNIYPSRTPQQQQLLESEELDEDNFDLLDMDTEFFERNAQAERFTPIQRIGPQALPSQRPISFPLQNNDHWGEHGQVKRYDNGNVYFRRDIDDVNELLSSMDYDEFVRKFGSNSSVD